MNITRPFVLRSDVVLVPVTALAPDVQAKIEFDEGDYAVSRRHGRMSSQVVDRETAMLLELFRQPCTIVDAVIENSRALSKEPRAWLEELLPHIGRFVTNGILVDADEEQDDAAKQRIDNGARVGAWEVQRCVSLIEDTEIYRVRDGEREGALKIARSRTSVAWIANEIAILGHIGGAPAPRLLDSGEHEGRPWLVMEWVDGVEAAVAATRHRHDRTAILELALSIVRAYAELHAKGVIHSDVHPRNVIANGREVRLIDFGLSRDANAPIHGAGRGGMYYFFEPEYLVAERAGGSVPSSFAGEQYAIGALLYFLITGVHYLDFRFDRAEMTRQGAEDPPLPFAARNLAPWPDVERILFRALEKNPANRFPSMHDLAGALAAVCEAERAAALATPLSDEARALLDEEIAGLRRGGALFASGYTARPQASINFGAAGAAMGLLRIAQVRSDPKLLALADVWRSRAYRFIGNDSGWFDEEGELPKRMLGALTPYHTAAGAHAVAALITAARGDAYVQKEATEAFVAASSVPCEEIDLTLGRSGTLLACALLHENGANVAALGNRVMAEIWSQLDERPPIASSQQAYLGVAHGWSGYLYAALRWSISSGTPLPSRVVDRLEELAAMADVKARGVYWRRQSGSPPHDYVPSWCNGLAGQLFLWTAAYDALGDARWLDLAERTAWSTWEEPFYFADLCCGSAGRAYALLNFYRHTGDREWLSRAIRLANHAASSAHKDAVRAHALWKGELGVAVLIADLESPENARMPFFE